MKCAKKGSMTMKKYLYKKHRAIVSEKIIFIMQFAYLLPEHRTLLVQTKNITAGKKL
jgi:hypothetical protein